MTNSKDGETLMDINDLMKPDGDVELPVIVEYDAIIFDGGGLAVTSWAAAKELERPEERVGEGSKILIQTVMSMRSRSKKDGQVVVVWDGYDNRAFRRGRHPWYKHGRGSIIDREEVKIVIDQCDQLLRAMGVATVVKDLHEADDVVATVSHDMSSRGMTVLVYSDDKDYLQLVNDGIHVCRRSLDKFVVTPQSCGSMGIAIGDRYLHQKALEGDWGDNIRGLNQIGPGKATKIMEEYPQFVHDCLHGEPDWEKFGDKTLRSVVKAGMFLLWSKPSEKAVRFAKSRGIELSDRIPDDESCLNAIVPEIRWLMSLVAMDREIEIDPPVPMSPDPLKVNMIISRLGMQSDPMLMGSILDFVGHGNALCDHDGEAPDEQF